MTAAWDDPDRAVQIEDDDPEALAGGEVEFAVDEEPEDFPSTPARSTPSPANLAAEGA